MKPDAESPTNRITALLEDVLGCKWSWSILRAVHAGTTRPGQLEKTISGISTKVLNERLRKLVAHGVFEKIDFQEIPPHVEYRFTELGERFFAVLQHIEALERGSARAGAPADEPVATSPRQPRH
ncbi:MAG: helix-turn-helix domain-containing protein [Stenotrophomonas sp.]